MTTLTPIDWPAYELLRIDRLFVDTDYQRPETKLVESIAADFRPIAFGAVIVSQRPRDRYALIDGQQRVGGARLRGVERVPALVSVGLTRAQEARAFVHLNRERLAVRAVQRFRAELAGEDPRALTIKRVLDARAIELVESSGFNAPPDALSAIVAVEAVFDRWGVDALEVSLDVITGAWPQQRGRFQGEIVRAVAQMVVQDSPEVGRLMAAMAGPRVGSPAGLMERSANLRRGTGLGGKSVGYTVEVLRLAYYGRRRRTRGRRT
jgi:hypothetical protein